MVTPTSLPSAHVNPAAPRPMTNDRAPEKITLLPVRSVMAGADEKERSGTCANAGHQNTLGHGRAGHTHHEAQIGDEPIIRAEDSRTECISANRAMAALVARDHRAFDAVTTTRDRTEKPPVQSLLSRHRAIA